MRLIVTLLCIFALTNAQAAHANLHRCRECEQLQQIPLNKPSVNQKTLEIFATEAALSVYSYNYSNYRRAFARAAKYFSPLGWQSYLHALKDSGNLDIVLDKKMVVKAVPTDAPIITGQGNGGGIYNWRIQIPMLVIYQASTGKIKQNIVVNMKVRRTDKFFGYDGIAIDNFVAKPRQELAT